MKINSRMHNLRNQNRVIKWGFSNLTCKGPVHKEKMHFPISFRLHKKNEWAESL